VLSLSLYPTRSLSPTLSLPPVFSPSKSQHTRTSLETTNTTVSDRCWDNNSHIVAEQAKGRDRVRLAWKRSIRLSWRGIG
jgi:hypothetical protein